MRSSEDAPVDSMGCEKAGSSLPPRVNLLQSDGGRRYISSIL